MVGDSLPAKIFQSKAAEKLAQVVHDVVDMAAGPDRVRARAQARADAAVIEAEGEGRVQAAKIKARIVNQELRRQTNIEAITHEALKALPPPEVNVSEERPTEDFVHRFFVESQDISDKDMQQIWGKLLAGEVMRPGSFHPLAMGALKNMVPADAQALTILTRFCWHIGPLTPVVFKVSDDIYVSNGLNFNMIQQLEALGLIATSSAVEFLRTNVPLEFLVSYGLQRAKVSRGGDQRELAFGHVNFTTAGGQLSSLCEAPVIPGFVSYVIEKWKGHGFTVTLLPPIREDH